MITNICSYNPVVAVEILLKATGNTPILKTKKWMVEKEKTVAAINDFVRKLLKLDPSECLVNIQTKLYLTFTKTTLKDL